MFPSARTTLNALTRAAVRPSLCVDSYPAKPNPWAAQLKRAIDVTVSAVLLIALCPLMLAVGIAIRLTSRGPAIFIQSRLGQGKLPFRIYKFRTMVANAEARVGELQHLNLTQGPTFKLKDDPRITLFGRFLRRSSMDELPQLLNVLQGHMSLVGPRPLVLRDCEGFPKDSHSRRFVVKPGITCLWQVMGRSAIGFEEWMALDVRYIDEWSVWLDLKILAMTVPAVLRGSGAM